MHVRNYMHAHMAMTFMARVFEALVQCWAHSDLYISQTVGERADGTQNFKPCTNDVMATESMSLTEYSNSKTKTIIRVTYSILLMSFMYHQTIIDYDVHLVSLFWLMYCDCMCTDCTSNQFRCSNGQCISASLRCNGVSNCMDGSDEIACSELMKYYNIPFCNMFSKG